MSDAFRPLAHALRLAPARATLTPPRCRVLSACTGEKALAHPNALGPEDVRLTGAARAAREARLPRCAAEALYTGRHHERLLRGVAAVRRAGGGVDLWIASAGFGLVAGDTSLVPYNVTFAGMRRPVLRAWAEALGLPAATHALLAAPAALTVVALGESYLEAAGLDGAVPLPPALGGPTLVFAGAAALAALPAHPDLFPVPLAVADTRRFGCGMVGLKGAVAGRLLAALPRAAADAAIATRLADAVGARDAATLLDVLAAVPAPA